MQEIKSEDKEIFFDSKSASTISKSATRGHKFSHNRGVYPLIGEGVPELEIVVELGNLVPRNKLALQKVFVALRYSQSKIAKYF